MIMHQDQLNSLKKYKIFCDGAYSSSRDQGGVGIVILLNDEVEWTFSFKYPRCTNNKMEIAAVILALRYIKKPCDSITIYTDSMLVIGQLSKGWKRNKNIALLKEADKQLKRVEKLCPNIEFQHVKGHQKDDSIETKYNNIVDKLAVKASRL